MSNLLNEVAQSLLESSLSRLWSKTQKHTCGAISGYRDERTRAENRRHHAKISRYLQGRGYSVTSVKGSYIENFGTDTAREVDEPSLFVCNHGVEGDDGGELKRDLIKMGKDADQDSILVIPHGGKGAYLVGTSRRDNAWPDYGQSVRVGDGRFGKVAGEFMSKIRGRKFAFEAVEPPKTRNGKWAQSLLVKEVNQSVNGIDLFDDVRIISQGKDGVLREFSEDGKSVTVSTPSGSIVTAISDVEKIKVFD